VIGVSRSDLLLLLRNELKLYLRSGAVSSISITFLVISQVLLHLVALSMAFASSMGAMKGMPAEALLIMLTVGLLSMLFMMTARSLAGIVQSFYTRGDLDLMLSSPVDRRAIIGVRMVAVALAVALEIAQLVWPFANVFVLFGRFAWFNAYLLVPAMAMLATSIGLAVTLLSFRTLGPRRTRVAVQVFAVVLGTGMMLSFYLPRMLSGEGRGRPGDGVTALANYASDYRDAVMVPARWVSEGFLPTLAFFIVALVLLVLAIRFSGEPIVRALTAISGGAARQRPAAVSRALQLSSGFRRVIVQKELRLIARDPFLIAQILQQSLMILPMTFALWQVRANLGVPLPWVSVIALAAGLAAPLSWLTVTAEDAPDLLASAPVSRAALIRAKVEAALLPVLPICLLPLVFLSRAHPWFAFCVSFSSLGAALSAALINMRNPVVRRRDSFKTRFKGNGFSGFLEVVSMFFWLGVCAVMLWAGRKFAGGH
jgi:ABC-2 type transport system permease protein